MVKKIVLVLLVVLVVIQFFRPKKNISAAKNANDITTIATVPDDVQTILNKACNDCHSNNTRYPWYAEIQPVAWWLNDHVQDGKKHLNYSEFASYPLRKQYKKLDETIEMVKEGEMPLSSYTIVHKDADLTADEKGKLTTWASSVMDNMKAKYPIDSLIKKK
jgi:hypothetical protein